MSYDVKQTQSDESLKLAHKAYKIIKEKIISLVLPPGSVISEKDLSIDLGVSRTPIREALHRLEIEQFVRIYPKRIITVSDISEKDIRDIFSIREVLEPLAAKIATPFLHAEQVEPFLRLFEAGAENRDYLQQITLDQDFHEMVVKNSRNNYLVNILLGFYDHLRRVRNWRRENIERHKSETNEEHLEVARALLAGDPDMVETMMRKHLQKATVRMVQTLF